MANSERRMRPEVWKIRSRKIRGCPAAYRRRFCYSTKLLTAQPEYPENRTP